MLSSAEPTPLASPAKAASKFAPPEPMSPGCEGSPLPLPCSLLPHSAQAFQIAITAPSEPGKFGSGVTLSLAVESVKLL